MVDRKDVQDITLFLTKCAVQRQLTSYQVIANACLGIEGNVSSDIGKRITLALGEIMDWCRRRNHPFLTALVVRSGGADSGLPGGGFWAALGYPPGIPHEVKGGIHHILLTQVYDYYSPVSVQDPEYTAGVNLRLFSAFENLSEEDSRSLHEYMSTVLPAKADEDHVLVNRSGALFRESVFGSYLLDCKLKDLGQ